MGTRWWWVDAYTCMLVWLASSAQQSQQEWKACLTRAQHALQQALTTADGTAPCVLVQHLVHDPITHCDPCSALTWRPAPCQQHAAADTPPPQHGHAGQHSGGSCSRQQAWVVSCGSEQADQQLLHIPQQKRPCGIEWLAADGTEQIFITAVSL